MDFVFSLLQIFVGETFPPRFRGFYNVCTDACSAWHRVVFLSSGACVRACMRVRMRVCVRVRVRACVRACVCACVCVAYNTLKMKNETIKLAVSRVRVGVGGGWVSVYINKQTHI